MIASRYRRDQARSLASCSVATIRSSGIRSRTSKAKRGPVGRGGPLPCKFLEDRVLAALERDLRRTPELWRAFFGAQYTRDAYELVRELRRRRNGCRV